MDCTPPGSSVHGMPQARTLEWVAIPFSRGSSRPRDRTPVSCTAGGFFTIWVTMNWRKYQQITYPINNFYLEHILPKYNSKKTVNKRCEHNSSKKITEDKRKKGCAISLITRKMNIKIMKHHYIPNRMAKISKTDNTKCWWGYKMTRALKYCFGDAKCITGIESRLAIFYKHTSYDTTIPLPGI